MSIPDAIIENIHNDPLKAALEACDFTLDLVENTPSWGAEEHESLLEGYALISAMEEAGLIRLDSVAGDVEGERSESCTAISTYLNEVARELEQQLSSHKLEALRKKFSTIVSSSFAYEFTEGDIARVQTLINELRDLLARDSELEEGHKRRLLKRLEELQKELHKKVSDLSHFYGLMGDFGVAVGKLGTDAKPIADRIREVIGIAWKAQARAEQLPSSAENPMLGHDGDPPALG